MGYNYRCTLRNKCGKRVTLPRLITTYLWKKKRNCPGCKKDTLKSVNEKEVARTQRRGCFCRGNWWPHNKGYIGSDENHVCIHADYVEAESIFMAEAIGATPTITLPSDPCPF